MNNFAIFTILLVTRFIGGRTKEPITCEAGHFTVGENASLACNFHQDMTSSQHHVYVIHYPFHAPTFFSGNDVLKCSGLNDGVPQCRVAEGYQFNNDITDRLTLRIPDVTELFAGAYVCQLVPPDGTPMILCNLTVKEQGVTETSQAWPVTDIYYTTLPQQSGSNDATIIAVSVTLSAILVILLATIAFLIIRFRNYRRAKEAIYLQADTIPRLDFDSLLSMSGDDSTTPKAFNDVNDQHSANAYNTISDATTTPRPSTIPPQEVEQTLVQADVYQCGPGRS